MSQYVSELTVIATDMLKLQKYCSSMNKYLFCLFYGCCVCMLYETVYDRCELTSETTRGTSATNNLYSMISVFSDDYEDARLLNVC